jgi:hypothetical protein
MMNTAITLSANKKFVTIPLLRFIDFILIAKVAFFLCRSSTNASW